jgi:hypothetical protein
MSRAHKCQVVSNRMRNLSYGSYTELDRREAEQERKRKANLALHIQRARIK